MKIAKNLSTGFAGTQMTEVNRGFSVNKIQKFPTGVRGHAPCRGTRHAAARAEARATHTVGSLTKAILNKGR